MHQIQTTLELAYATRRLVEVSYIQDGNSSYVTNVNVLRREAGRALASAQELAQSIQNNSYGQRSPGPAE